MNQKTKSNDNILEDAQALKMLVEQNTCNDMKGADISNELKHYLYLAIDKIQLKSNGSWWDTIYLYPKKSDSPINTILCFMLAYRWKANEIHIVDSDNNFYKPEIPIQNLPQGWYIRIWWD